MTPREFRQEKEFEFDHFTELTSTGISPNYVNIELFAHEYHRAKLKLLGIADVVKRSFKAKNRQGEVMFSGVAGTKEESIQMAYDQFDEVALTWEYSFTFD